MIRRARGAFTLVEVLVVTAVISVLATLLLAGISRSTEASRRIVCASNLRQLGLAAQMYWNDNDSECFRYRGERADGGDVYWFGRLERGAEGHRRFDPTHGALYRYLQDRGVEVCPSVDYTFPEFKLKAVGAAYGYGYNLNLSAPIDEAPVMINQVRRPALTALFADCAQVNTFQPPASPSNPMLEEFYYFNTYESTVHFRHSSRANAVFCDGHADSLEPEPASLDKRLPSQTIGRLDERYVKLNPSD
ncbi:MAG: prepilin-type N-terminal cleavage/methylation domain-containing protein [Verrucomicrobia bacterium]|nr:prepilin-type N-terminal cleavage/methylation domain-containing protein [Verrucomicrobiota bacterium]